MENIESINNVVNGSGLLNLAVWGLLFLVFLFKLLTSIRIVPTQSAYIVERLGKYHSTLHAGLHILIPFLDKVSFIQDLKEETIEVPPQMCFTRDNVQIEVDGVIYISVLDAQKASYGITDYRFAAIQLAQTTMRSVFGTLELDATFEERELINSKIVAVLSEVGATWGIRVHRYEIKNIIPPNSVKEAMERQMTAEREKRALIAKSEGERQSRINTSEGVKQESINRSEGEMQRMINEAEGTANQITALASATALAIENIASAVTSPGGQDAVYLNLSQSYFEKLDMLGKSQIIFPADLRNPQTLLEQAGIIKSVSAKK
ncbi:MAG: SPFH domain-containing protein [Spirochaetia bacterium]|nr:SPFH domain-containing protein [Spirochaetia bacterium]